MFGRDALEAAVTAVHDLPGFLCLTAQIPEGTKEISFASVGEDTNIELFLVV